MSTPNNNSSAAKHIGYTTCTNCGASWKNGTEWSDVSTRCDVCKPRKVKCEGGNCEITESADFKLLRPMPIPTREDMKDPFFNQLFDIVSKRRFTCPEYYEGWQIGTGCHAKVIFDQIKEVK